MSSVFVLGTAEFPLSVLSKVLKEIEGEQTEYLARSKSLRNDFFNAFFLV